MENTRVREWMTRNPITVSSSCTLYEAYRLMMKQRIRRLLVVDQGQLVGIVTLEDMRRKIPDSLNDADPAQTRVMVRKTPVSTIMTREPKTIQETVTLVQAAQLMLAGKISTLPVMSGSRLVGIITESDIFKALVKVLVIQPGS